MKKLLVAALIGLTAVSAQAHGYGYYGHRNGWGWVAPAVVGGAVVYALTRPQPIVVQQPVVVQPQYQAPYGYHWEAVLDANCNCYRNVLVQN